MFSILREFNQCHLPAGTPGEGRRIGGRFARRNSGVCHTVPGASKGTPRRKPAVSMDEEARKAWDRAFGETKVTPEDLVNAYASPHSEVNAEIKWSAAGGFTISVNQDDATAIRQLKPHPSNSGWLAYHEAFLLGEHSQGKGVGKQVFAETLRVYQSLGVKDILLDANIDVGSYAWARYGFDFAGTSAQGFTFRTATIKRADPLVQIGLITAQQAKDFGSAAIQRGGGVWKVADARMKLPPRDAARVVNHYLDAIRGLRENLSADTKDRLLADAKSGVVPVGKLLLLDRIWSARFNLSNPAQRDRLRAYIGRDVFRD